MVRKILESLTRNYPDELYADLILLNAGYPLKKNNAATIHPKLLTGITHRIGGADSWEQLASIITGDKKYLQDFKERLKEYSMRDVDYLFLNLFLKAGWRDRRKSGLVVESSPRQLDKESIMTVLNTKGVYLDTVFVHFEANQHEVVSYAPFSYSNDSVKTGAAYVVRVANWKNTADSQKSLIDMLRKENRI